MIKLCHSDEQYPSCQLVTTTNMKSSAKTNAAGLPLVSEPEDEIFAESTEYPPPSAEEAKGGGNERNSGVTRFHHAIAVSSTRRPIPATSKSSPQKKPPLPLPADVALLCCNSWTGGPVQRPAREHNGSSGLSLHPAICCRVRPSSVVNGCIPSRNSAGNIVLFDGPGPVM
jgi:hypothetical protein